VKYRLPGINFLCGIDEAGRGPLAGPVVAAALILKPGLKIPGLNDSKKLSGTMRDNLWDVIIDSALSYGIGLVDSEEIERINILQATFAAMRMAVDKLAIKPDYILVDGRDFPHFSSDNGDSVIHGKAIIKGDQKSASIAGASILAKVHRDRIMRQYAETYPEYGFEQHKGYATELHRENILKYGPCPIHRKKFLRKLYETEHIETLLIS
jgi:ribonuclease HII